LLKAGHKRTEVSRLTGISRSSVQRISAEATTEQFDDTAERLKRRIGRPSIVKGFWETISDILEKQPDLPSSHILRQVQNSGYSGGKTVLYAVVASLRRINSISMQNEAFEWMRAVQQTAIRGGSVKTIESNKRSFHCSTHRPQYTESIEQPGK
jgi:hypothetical protein